MNAVMKKVAPLAISLLLSLTVASCSDTPDDIPPPSPPNPFPISLETLQERMDRLDGRAELAIRYTFWTATHEDSNVAIRYTRYALKDGEQRELESREIYNEPIPVNVKQTLRQTIELDAYGDYRIVMLAEYGGAGQERQYVIRYTDRELKNGLE